MHESGHAGPRVLQLPWKVGGGSIMRTFEAVDFAITETPAQVQAELWAALIACKVLLEAA
jgi:hypothetical protein